jgi:hypothetical protein
MPMSELADALQLLERAVARLEAAAANRPPTTSEPAPLVATEAAARIDAALARLAQLLEPET